MKPVILVFFATICYAGANSIIDLKLSKYNQFSIMICYLSVILAVATIGRLSIKVEVPSFDFPTGSAIMMVIILGIIYALADYLYLSAYSSGGSAVTITSILMMMPIFVSVIKLLTSGTLPNGWQIASYVAACTALMLMTKGGEIAK